MLSLGGLPRVSSLNLRDFGLAVTRSGPLSTEVNSQAKSSKVASPCFNPEVDGKAAFAIPIRRSSIFRCSYCVHLHDDMDERLRLSVDSSAVSSASSHDDLSRNFDQGDEHNICFLVVLSFKL
jgi:hypothetical protein